MEELTFHHGYRNHVLLACFVLACCINSGTHDQQQSIIPVNPSVKVKVTGSELRLKGHMVSWTQMEHSSILGGFWDGVNVTASNNILN